MLLYVTDLIYDGRLSTKDNKMATLIGRISDNRGRLFNQLIVDMLLDMGVFRVEPNVKKINKKLIADENGNTLGDIDVLIIDREMHHVYVAEVKDFNFSRNPYEIQMCIRDSHRSGCQPPGEAGDRRGAQPRRGAGRCE